MSLSKIFGFRIFKPKYTQNISETFYVKHFLLFLLWNMHFLLISDVKNDIIKLRDEEDTEIQISSTNIYDVRYKIIKEWKHL